MTAPDLSALIARMLTEVGSPGRKPTAKGATGASTPPPAPGAGPLPPEWRLSARWTDTALICIEQHTVCRNCASREVATQPHIFLQRYHPQYGIHLEATQGAHPELPRRITQVDATSPYCRHCFISSNTAAAQPRLPFDLATPGTTSINGVTFLTDLFNANGAPSGACAADPLGAQPTPPTPVLRTLPTIIGG